LCVIWEIFPRRRTLSSLCIPPWKKERDLFKAKKIRQGAALEARPCLDVPGHKGDSMSAGHEKPLANALVPTHLKTWKDLEGYPSFKN